MTKLLDGLYLCPITGQNVQVLDERVECLEIKDSGDCKNEKFLLNMVGCSVYIDANRAYAQSQPKCTGEREQTRTEYLMSLLARKGAW